MRKSVTNFMNNIKEPIVVINSILQLDFKNALKSTARFTINSTIGMAGAFDVAKMNFGIKKRDKKILHKLWLNIKLALGHF